MPISHSSPISLTGASVGGSATTGAWSVTAGGGILSNTAQTSNPSAVTYTPAAGFTGIVTLTLTSNFGTGCLAATDTRTINVTPASTATAGGPDNVCQSATPSAITLSGASVGGGATTGAWSIVSGGGTLSSTAQTATPATVTYTPAVNYSGSVTLRLTTDFGTGCASATANRTINVTSLPTANFTASPLNITAGSTVTFTNTSTGSPTSWSWSFPGGTPSTSTAQNPTVVYNLAGTYSVSLIASTTCPSVPFTRTNYITVTALSNPLTYGSNGTFIVPPGVTCVKAEAWGGGGGSALMLPMELVAVEVVPMQAVFLLLHLGHLSTLLLVQVVQEEQIVRMELQGVHQVLVH